ncbi:DUF885 family protein [Sphingomonas sp.]|uniref:DUF885 family protein n=1 Tax=Sphingomonas sp. TaxID=28214 RepID=UPI003B3BC5A0
MIDRRLFLAGSALFCMGAGDRVSDISAQLDDAAKVDGQERIDLLRRIDRNGLPPGLALDVAAALRGAALEVALAQATNAKARYLLQLRLQAGLDISPDALFAWCTRRADAITTRLDRLLQAEGLTRNSVAERLRLLARDPRYLYPDSDAGRDAAVEEMNRWLVAARARLSAQFGTLPPAVDHIAVRRMTQAEEAAGKAGYRVVPSYDGSTPGAYFVDLHDIRRRPAWSLPSVVHHETLPGHLLQLPLQARANPHPLRLRAASGFIEGWAFYAEQLAAEAGAFAQDGRAEIGYLQWMLFRLGRAMIDIGLNLRGWTPDYAGTFLRELQGDPMIFAPFEKDIAKARSDPGGFAGQAANWHGFSQLRASALAGGRDVRALHDRLLAHGAFPLALFNAI